MYESEYKKLENTEKMINLHELLRVAPKLTHFVDKIHHFDFENLLNPNNLPNGEPLSLIHTKYIYLDLCRSQYGSYETIKSKLDMILSNIAVVTTLDIRLDKDYTIKLPLMENLKVFKFNYYAHSPFGELKPFPRQIIASFITSAPNLEEIFIHSKHINVDPNLFQFLFRLPINCPNLRGIKMFFQLQDYYRQSNQSTQAIHHFIFIVEDSNNDNRHKLLKLEYLDLRGFFIPIDLWDKLLSLTPNLKFLAFERSTDPQNLIMKKLTARNCPNAKFDLENPFEIEEQYRIYCQRTYGFDKDRYL